MAVYPDGIVDLPSATDWTGDPNAAPDSAKLTAARWEAVLVEIEALEAELGVQPSGSSATVAARLAAVDSALAGKLGVAATAANSSAVGGIAVTGVPATGQVLKATSSSAATWQNDSTGGGGSVTIDSDGTISDGTTTIEVALDADVAAVAASRVPTTRTVTAGTGLTGGGDLSADRSFAVSYGTTAGTAAQGNDSRIVGALQAANNLADVASPATSRTNLGLGTAAVVNTGTTSGTVPVLGASGTLAIARLATGTPDGTKFVRDDGTLATPAGGGGFSPSWPGVTPVLAVGAYMAGWLGDGPGTASLAAGSFQYAIPVVYDQTWTADRVAIEVTGAAAAGGIIRLGLYASSLVNPMLPGDINVEWTAGAPIDSTTTGVKELIINQTFTAGVRYWLHPSAAVAAATVRTCGVRWPRLPTSQSEALNPTPGRILAERSGASNVPQPSTWPGTVYGGGTAVQIVFRRSA